MLKNFFGGYHRKIASLKQGGVMSIIEGKQPMSFKGYKFLARKALGQEGDFNLSIFSHFFLLLCWNLIARCISVGSLIYSHISWTSSSPPANLITTFPFQNIPRLNWSQAPSRSQMYSSSRWSTTD